MDFILQKIPGVESGVPVESSGYAPLAAESFEMGFAQIQRRTARLFSVAVLAPLVMWVGWLELSWSC